MFFLQELQADIQDHLSNLEYINTTGTELINKADKSDKANKLKTDMDKLNKRWSAISGCIDERVVKLEAVLEQLGQFQVRLRH